MTSSGRGEPPDAAADRDETLLRLADAIARVEAASPADSRDRGDSEYARRHAVLKERALTLLDHRMRSCAEMRTRLLGIDDDPPLVDTVIDDLRRSGLLNDAQFASEWVRQRHAKGKSRAALRHELRHKGVSGAHCEDALADIDDTDEEDVARRLVEKKAATIRILPSGRAERQKNLRRMVGYLARRGYSPSTAMRVCIDVLDERYRALAEE